MERDERRERLREHVRELARGHADRVVELGRPSRDGPLHAFPAVEDPRPSFSADGAFTEAAPVAKEGGGSLGLVEDRAQLLRRLFCLLEILHDRRVASCRDALHAHRHVLWQSLERACMLVVLQGADAV